MRSQFIKRFATLGRRAALPVITAILIAGTTGMLAYPQHSHGDFQAASRDLAWPESLK
jgi:hypothetical protein